MKLDGTSEAALARSLLALPPDERQWITFAEARILFSTKGDQYAFDELDQDGRKAVESFAAQAPVRHQLHAGRGAGLFRAVALGGIPHPFLGRLTLTLTRDEARRIAANIAKLRDLLTKSR